jgi:hypothetical protein
MWGCDRNQWWAVVNVVRNLLEFVKKLIHHPHLNNDS